MDISRNQNHNFESHDSGELSSVTQFSCKSRGEGHTGLSWKAGTWLDVAELGSSDQPSNMAYICTLPITFKRKQRSG